jgi:hypothetical protein
MISPERGLLADGRELVFSLIDGDYFHSKSVPKKGVPSKG